MGKWKNWFDNLSPLKKQAFLYSRRDYMKAYRKKRYATDEKFRLSSKEANQRYKAKLKMKKENLLTEILSET